NLVDKTKLLLGIKGYHTDLSLPDKLIIERYSDLWNVERAFRISKSDISMRPIYHFRKQAIMAHILICTVALAVLKFMEIKTGKSPKHVVDSLKSVTDGLLLNTVTNKEFRMRSQITEETNQLLKRMGITH
ncbi:MAG: transposase, partial [Patescibacteria group bacterium]